MEKPRKERCSEIRNEIVQHVASNNHHQLSHIPPLYVSCRKKFKMFLFLRPYPCVPPSRSYPLFFPPASQEGKTFPSLFSPLQKLRICAERKIFRFSPQFFYPPGKKVLLISLAVCDTSITEHQLMLCGLEKGPLKRKKYRRARRFFNFANC